MRVKYDQDNLLRGKPCPTRPAIASKSGRKSSTVPAASAGAVAVIEVAELTLTSFADVAPNATDAGFAKFVPVIVTNIPPALDPLFGETFFTVTLKFGGQPKRVAAEEA